MDDIDLKVTEFAASSYVYALEQKRRQKSRLICKPWLWVLIPLLYFIIISSVPCLFNSLIIAIIMNMVLAPLIVIISIFLFWGSFVNRSDITINIKNELYPKLVKILDDNLYYYDITNIPEPLSLVKKFKVFELFTSCESISADDIITGKYKNKDIDVIEFRAELNTNISFKGKNVNSIITQYHGVLFQTNISKYINTPVIITQNKCPLKPSVKHLKQRVFTESKDFNDIFKVYCSDQVEARYFLTTAAMERILKLYKNNKENNFDIIVYQNNISIIVNESKDMFEISLFKPINNKKQYIRVLAQMKEFLDYITVLKLDLDVKL